MQNLLLPFYLVFIEILTFIIFIVFFLDFFVFARTSTNPMSTEVNDHVSF